MKRTARRHGLRGQKETAETEHERGCFRKKCTFNNHEEKKMIFEGLSRFCSLKTEKKQENIKIRQESIIISKKLRLPLQLEKV